MQQESTGGLWSAVKDALSGSRHDHTAGNLNRSIVLLAIPMVLEMLMESLFGLVDIFFVSSLGTTAVAAVSLTESMLVILFAIAVGLSISTTAMVARRIGEKDDEGAADAAAQAIFIGVSVSVLIAIIGVVFAPDLLKAMGGEKVVIEKGQNFTRMIFAGSVTIFLLFLNNAIFRGAGDAAIAMRVLWIANAFNIILNPCLILGLGPFPELGLLGSAVGTTIARGTGVAIQFYVLFSGGSRIRLLPKHLRVNGEVMWRLAVVSANGILQFLISTSSWIGLIRIISTYGSPALAGYTIAIRLMLFALLPSWGLANAAATLVGQNLGAGRPDRSEQAVWIAGRYNMIFLGSVAVVLLIVTDPLIHVFSNDPDVVRNGVRCLRYLSLGYVFYAWGMVTVQAFNGAGDTRTPTFLNLVCLWGLQIPLAWVLAKELGAGADGVFVAIPISQAVLAMVAVYFFKRGAWKGQRI